MIPAVDRTIAVDRLAFDDRAYILSSKDSPGGRGINAARVIHSFGGKTIAIIPAGGDRGARFENYLLTLRLSHHHRYRDDRSWR